ncbi:hypothetical protein COT08_00825, partial [Candidatus Woesebacteria bacterium CG07_land_8_20_14_0_80_44_9]
MKRLPAQNIAEDTDFLRNKLKLKSLEVKQEFQKKYPSIDLSKIRQYSAHIIGAGALTGTLLFAPLAGTLNLPQPLEIINSIRHLADTTSSDFPQKLLVDSIAKILPERPGPLALTQEKALEQIFSQIIGIKTKANLEGEHLNTTYGLIGVEQHLKRYPGDSVANHGPYYEEGMAPGLGAWGYFAPSRENLSKSLEETEKWYAAVQTLYLPDWSKRVKYLREWYKYRKVLIVNTKNGNAMVAATADSGPAAWTGRHFGGSPEVMEYLGGSK